MGKRGPKPSPNARRKRLELRVSADELGSYESAAAAEGLPVGTWVRLACSTALLRGLDRQLRKALREWKATARTGPGSPKAGR